MNEGNAHGVTATFMVASALFRLNLERQFILELLRAADRGGTLSSGNRDAPGVSSALQPVLVVSPYPAQHLMLVIFLEFLVVNG